MNKRNKWFYAKRTVFWIAFLCLILSLIFRSGISLHSILSYIPEDPLLTAFVFLILYALKSATIFFPLLILEVAVGHLFPPLVAFCINFTGMLIVLTVPYWIGRAAGMKHINKLITKYPKFQKILGKQQDHSFFLCFFLRIISCLPGDVVTMYLGATHVPFWQNFGAGLLGILPGMILATFMGISVQDPNSPAFWISVILSVSLAALSTVFYYIYLRHQKRKEEGHS